MTDPTQPEEQPDVTPSRRDRLRPRELLSFAGLLAAFAGLVVLLVTRVLLRFGIAAVVAFIVALLVLALLGLGGKPSKEDLEARKDLQDPGAENWH